MENFISADEIRELQLGRGCVLMLRKLRNQKRIGGRNIPEVICVRWIKHLPKEERKSAVGDWERCIMEGLVLTKPKPSGRYVSLNPRLLRKVLSIIEKADGGEDAKK